MWIQLVNINLIIPRNTFWVFFKIPSYRIKSHFLFCRDTCQKSSGCCLLPLPCGVQDYVAVCCVQGQRSGYAGACWLPTKKRGSWCAAELINNQLDQVKVSLPKRFATQAIPNVFCTPNLSQKFMSAHLFLSSSLDAINTRMLNHN